MSAPRTRMIVSPEPGEGSIMRADAMLARLPHLVALATLAHARHEPGAAEKTRAVLDAAEAARGELRRIADCGVDGEIDAQDADVVRLHSFLAAELARGAKHSAASLERARAAMGFTHHRLRRALATAFRQGRVVRVLLGNRERRSGFGSFIAPVVR